MSLSRTTVLKALATIAGAALLTKGLYLWPDLLPGGLRQVGNSLIDLSHPQSAETSAELELVFVCLLALTTAAAVVAIATRIISKLWPSD